MMADITRLGEYSSNNISTCIANVSSYRSTCYTSFVKRKVQDISVHKRNGKYGKQIKNPSKETATVKNQ